MRGPNGVFGRSAVGATTSALSVVHPKFPASALMVAQQVAVALPGDCWRYVQWWQPTSSLSHRQHLEWPDFD